MGDSGEEGEDEGRAGRGVSLDEGGGKRVGMGGTGREGMGERGGVREEG